MTTIRIANKKTLDYERRLRNAGILRITRTSLEIDRSKRLLKEILANDASAIVSKKRKRDGNPPETSIEGKKRKVTSDASLNDEQRAIEPSNHLLEDVGISFLLELFSASYFLHHDFVYAWSSKIRTKINMAMVTYEGEESTIVVPNFETDLCCCLCFVLFSPVSIVAESSCLTLFSELDFESYVSKQGYSVLDKRYEYREPEHRSCAKERERFYNILKGCWKEIYIEYATTPPTCLAFLAVLVKRSGSISNVVRESSRFRKFMVYAVLVEFVETLFYNIKQTYARRAGSNERMDVLDDMTVEIIVIALIHFKNAFSAALTLSQLSFFDNLVPTRCRNSVQVVDHFETVFFNDWTW